MEFNKEAHIARMKPFVDKLIKHLSKHGVEFAENAGAGLENVVFRKASTVGSDTIIRIVEVSHHSFYRFSGICCVYKEIGENSIEAIEVTDAMFMDKFMRPIVELHFNIKN